ncbi:MAG: tripartite tricarboxylate transporter substrate binding protein [Betaproteobacteria bacterium]|nr:tripartite tricarboxylate transporter substrate binding protein [Betaproteobacteria bacterium]
MLRQIIMLLLAACSAIQALPASAQAFPSKPMRIIVPLQAGPADTVTRALGQKLSETWGQPVIVENRPGANMIIGAEAAAKAAPDGYTLLFASDALMSINQFLYSRLPYDPEKDFTPVAILAYTITTVMVSAQLPVNSVAELVQLAKAQPGKFNYGTLGLGSNGHLAAELFKAATGVEIAHVPFKGSPDLIQAMASNEVQMAFQGPGTALPSIRAGKIKALAVYSQRRLPTLATAQTMAEAGFPNVDGARAWYGIVAPALTPKDVVAQIAREMVRVATTPEFREKYLVGFNLEPVGAGPDELAAVIRADREKYSQLARKLNIRLD